MLPPWATKPEFYIPILVSLVFFILSLYGREIRRFMSVPPSKARNWWNAGLLDAYQTELDTLKRINNNAYELMVYTLTELGRDCRISILYIAAGCFVQILLELSHAPK